MVRIVLYAEGPGETGSSLGFPLSPGKHLPIAHEGPAHVLVRRCFREVFGRAEHALRFEVPLRYQAREVRGGDLRNARVLRRILHWPMPAMRPDVAIVLVDQDGDTARRFTLTKVLEEPQPISLAVLAVAVQEFESWLVSDHPTVQDVLELREPAWPSPERMLPGEAKGLLAKLVQSSPRAPTPAELRLELARAMNLSRARTASRSLDRFVLDLKRAIPGSE